LQSGETVPQVFLERRIVTVKRELAEQVKQRQEMSQRYATYWKQIQKASKDGEGRGAARSMEGILQVYKNLAQKKIVASAPLGLGRIIPTSFGETVVSPFNYGFTIGNLGNFGPPVLSASANNSTGQISTSAVTNDTKESNGYISSEMGIYFQAKFGPANLLASSSPSCTYQWWTNSIKDSHVRPAQAAAFGILDPHLPRPYSVLTYTAFEGWFETQSNALRFDFGTDLVSPASFEIAVTPSWLVIFVSSWSWVTGEGWPGSLAGAVISMAVPSITLVLNPAIIRP
jgi:hypothetical protein